MEEPCTNSMHLGHSTFIQLVNVLSKRNSSVHLYEVYHTLYDNTTWALFELCETNKNLLAIL